MHIQTDMQVFTEYSKTQADCWPADFVEASGIERTLALPAGWGAGYCRQTRLRDGLEIDSSDLLLREPVTLESEFRYPHLELALNLQGGPAWSVHGQTKEYTPRSGSACLTYMHQAKLYAELPDSSRMIHLELRFDPMRWKSLLQELKIESSLSFFYLESDITPGMYEVAGQLSGSSYQGLTRRLYMEGKSMELLALFLEAAEARRKPVSSLKTSDIRCIHAASEILLGMLEHPPSLVGLARMVHINEQKLKVGFKEVFGTTVFGFVRQQRLEKAKRLLETDKISVSEASSMVGYSNFSHFAALFRKTYGFNPGMYGKSGQA